MPFSIHSPRIACHQEADGSWVATLYIEGKWWAQMCGFSSRSAARKAIQKKYL